MQTTPLALNSHKNITLPPSQAFLHPKTTILRFRAPKMADLSPPIGRRPMGNPAHFYKLLLVGVGGMIPKLGDVFGSQSGQFI